MNKAEKTVLLVIKLLLSTTGFLLVLAASILGISIFASAYTGQWHWFQRSGALVVSIGAILSTRRLLRIGLGGLLEGRSYFDVASNSRQGQMIIEIWKSGVMLQRLTGGSWLLVWVQLSGPSVI
jgi:hypothetical protein